MKLKGSVMRCVRCGAVMDPVEGEGGPQATIKAWRASIDFRPFLIAGGLFAAALVCGAAVYFLPDAIGERASPVAELEQPQDTTVSLDERSLGADDSALNEILGGWTTILGTPETDWVMALEPALDGGAYVAIASDGDRAQTVLARIDDDGRIDSTTPLEPLKNAEHIAISSHPNGDVFVIGRVQKELMLERFNALGASQWARRLPATDGGAGIASISVSGGFVFAAAGADVGSVQVESLSAAGRVVWRSVFASQPGREFVQVAPAPAGGVYVAFYEPSGPDGGSASVRLLDEAGEPVWSRVIEAAIGSDIAGMAAAPDGGVFVLMSGLAPTLHYYNRAGRRSGAMTLPATAVEADLAMTGAANGVFVGASYRLAEGEGDIWLARIAETGQVMWDEYPRIPGEDELRFLAATPDGGVIAAGGAQDAPQADRDVFVRFALGASSPLGPAAFDDLPAPPDADVMIDEQLVIASEGPPPEVVTSDIDAPEPADMDIALNAEPVAADRVEGGDPIADELSAPPSPPTTPAPTPAAPQAEEAQPSPSIVLRRDTDDAGAVTPVQASDAPPARAPARQATAFLCSIECIAMDDPSMTFPLDQTYVDQEPTPVELFETLVKAEMLQLCVAMNQSVDMSASPTCSPL